mgnify:CR=1 FL=1
MKVEALLQEVLKHYALGGFGEKWVGERMAAGVTGIVTRMQAKGITPAAAPARTVIRDAIFRLLRTAVPSGDICDLIRDRVDDDVVAKLAPTVSAGTDLQALVVDVKNELMEALF